MNEQKTKDLDQLIKEAREAGQKNVIKTQLSSSLGAEDNSAVGPKSIPKIRTYGYDAQDAIKKADASLARIKIAEDKLIRSGPRVEKNNLFLFIVIFLIVVGIGGVMYAYIYFNQQKNITAVAPEVIVKKAISKNTIL